MSRPAPGTRGDYVHFSVIATRWMDNDIYGHVNNVVYYSFFDTAIADYLLTAGGLDPWNAEIVGMAVENGCRYHSSIAYPDTVHAGVRVAHLGRSSVRYEIGIFRNDEEMAAAEGHFVHVFVERENQRPTPIPDPIRSALEALVSNRESLPVDS
ncbi:MAG: thioesterase family protein [Geminicoccaceae bacterium]